MALHGVAHGMLGDDAVDDKREEDTLIEYPPRDGSKGARVTVRLPARLVGYIGDLAESNNRTLAMEVQVALELHEAMSRLAAVTNQEVQTEIHRTSRGTFGVVGEGAQRFADTLRAQIARDWAGSFFDDRAKAREFAAGLLSWRPATPAERAE